VKTNDKPSEKATNSRLPTSARNYSYYCQWKSVFASLRANTK